MTVQGPPPSRLAPGAAGAGRGIGPSTQALLWMLAAGLLYSVVNALLRIMSLRMDAFQALGLVYGSTLLVMLPFVIRHGAARYWPRSPGGIVVRGTVHWLAMCIWLMAVSRITLAETTAIGFTTPLFVMVGAALLLNEPLRRHRSIAALAGFAGVLVVVAPKASGVGGAYTLLMLGSAAVFAASFLLSKRLTRIESAAVIVVWQSLVVTVFSLPLAILRWQPQPASMWLMSVVCGALAALGNYCLTRAFSAGDISASQPARFLDLLWACLLGWLIFDDRPEGTTLAGGLIILAATVWVAHRDARPARSFEDA